MASPTLLDTRPEFSEPQNLLASAVETGLVIERSRFLTYLAPVTEVAEADDVIRERRAQHPGARHTCTALALGTPVSLQRSNDDGEPGGTAGMPMAQALRARHMTNIVAVVTRYFGRVKLGAGGLTRAYGSAAVQALDEAERRGAVTQLVVREGSLVRAGYDVAGPLEASVRAWVEGHPGASVAGSEYTARGIELTLWHAPEFRDAVATAVAELSGGAASLNRAGWTLADVPLPESSAE